MPELLTTLRLAGGCISFGGAPSCTDLVEVVPNDGMDEKEVRRVRLLLAPTFVPFVDGRRGSVVAILRVELVLCAYAIGAFKFNHAGGVSQRNNNELRKTAEEGVSFETLAPIGWLDGRD